MALKKEGSQITIKAPSGNIPYVPAKSYVSIAFDSFKPTLNRLQTEADQTAQANYFQIFKLRLEINLKNLEMIMQWIQIK